MILADLVIIACALTPLGYAVYRAWRLAQLEACFRALNEPSPDAFPLNYRSPYVEPPPLDREWIDSLKVTKRPRGRSGTIPFVLIEGGSVGQPKDEHEERAGRMLFVEDL